jgi:flavin-dependent dehydrogenase
MTSTYDCVVVGGGPAGSTAAALLAGAGCSTLLVERERVPRRHVGGSLAPACRTTLARLGLLEAIAGGGHPPSVGIDFVDQAGRPLWQVRYADALPAAEARGWHVPRDAFDRLLFHNAAARGAECRDRTRVLEVLFDGPRACGVRIEGPGEMREEVVRSKVVIDASGQQALLAARLGLREPDPRLRQSAVWTCYRGGRRHSGPDGVATTIVRSAARGSWFWYTPLAEDLVSVGVVGPGEQFQPGRGKPESVFEEQLVACPAVAEWLIDAHLADDFRTAAEFDFAVRHAAGDGWVLAGDAGGFVDPLFQQGVWLALRSGEQAADAVLDGLARGDASGPQLGGWVDRHAVGVERLRRLVYAFYAEGFCPREFSERNPEHQRAFAALLAGRLFAQEGEEARAAAGAVDALHMAARQSRRSADNPATEPSPLN